LVINRSNAVTQGTDFSSAAITGTGSLTQAGPSTLTFTANNTYSGATTVTSGTVQIGNGGTTGGIASTSGVTLSSPSSALVFDRTDNYGGNFNPLISGSGGVTVLSGTLTPVSNNTFTGNVAINGGATVIDAAGGGGPNVTTSALGNPQTPGRLITVGTNATLEFTSEANQFGNVASNTIGVQIVVNSGNLYSDGNPTTLGSIVLNNGATMTDANTSNTAYGSGGFELNGTVFVTGNGTSAITAGNGGAVLLEYTGTRTTTFDVAAGSTLLVSAPVANEYGLGTPANLTLTDAGTMILSNTNSYSGATTVSGGTMIVSGSLSGTKSVSVASAATLEVDGLVNTSATNTVNGTLKGIGTVGTITTHGGTLAPGLTAANSQTATGTLTATGAVNLSGSTNFNIRLGLSVSGTDGDQLAATGASNAVSLNGANLQLTLGTAVNNPAVIDTYYLIINGGAGGTGVGGNIFAGLTQGTSFNVSNGFTFTIDYASTFLGSNSAPTVGGGDDVVLELTAIPEPSTWATMLGGFGMLLFVQRIRRKARR
jgi:autotransporter-associated beta strand protein